jgi:hypothetical protein
MDQFFSIVLRVRPNRVASRQRFFGEKGRLRQVEKRADRHASGGRKVEIARGGADEVRDIGVSRLIEEVVQNFVG